MYWYLFFVFFVLFITLPIKYKMVAKINLLNLSGEIFISILNISIIKLKIKIKKNFIYITKKGITYKQKLTPSNIDIIFVLNLIKEFYFRIKLVEIIETAEIGVKNSAFISAMSLVGFDLTSKGILSKIKNNKKSSHILVENRAKYNDDCLTCKFEMVFCINLLDILYSAVSSKIKSKGVKYETSKEENVEI